MADCSSKNFSEMLLRDNAICHSTNAAKRVIVAVIKFNNKTSSFCSAHILPL
jgi:hypothetical protein